MDNSKSRIFSLSNLSEFALIMLRGIAGGALIILASRIIVTFVPVQFTMQTFVIITMSLICSRSTTYASLATFLALCGPRSIITSGYVVGFLIVPLILHNARHNGTLLFAVKVLLSYFLISLLGVAVLGQFIGYRAAWVGGFLFFIPAELFKAILTFITVRVLFRQNKPR